MIDALHMLVAAVAGPTDPIPLGRGLGGLVVAIGGLAGLRKAWKLHQRTLALENTPVMAIAEANAGFVRIRGKILCDRPVLSPFTQTPCCFYRVEVCQANSAGPAPDPGWRPLHRDNSTESFRLQDGTGVLEILPRWIELDAPPTFQQEVGSTAGNATGKRLLAYADQNCPSGVNDLVAPLVKGTLLSPWQAPDPRVLERLQLLQESGHRLPRREPGRPLLFRETCFQPGKELEVAGTVIRNGSGRALAKGPEKTPFLLSVQFGQPLRLEPDREARNFTIVSVIVVAIGLLMTIASYYLVT